MITLYEWLVLSSKNATKYSLFIKGFLTTLTGVLLPLAVYFGSQITPELVTPIIDNIVHFVDLILQAVGVALMVWGGIRKIYLTFKGQNHLEIK